MNMLKRLECICEIANCLNFEFDSNNEYFSLYTMDNTKQYTFSKKKLKLANKLYKSILDLPVEKRLSITSYSFEKLTRNFTLLNIKYK